LTDEERRQIKLFLDERLAESKAQRERARQLRRSGGGHLAQQANEYIICPMAQPPNPKTPYWRFNCAGFVVTAYGEAGITLFADEVPLMKLAEMQRAYPQYANELEKPEVRQRMGVGDGDSWPVALPGHVLNSVDRSPDVVRMDPFCPASGDEWFPSRRTDETSSEGVQKPVA
jgi:hypothetical protein